MLWIVFCVFFSFYHYYYICRTSYNACGCICIYMLLSFCFPFSWHYECAWLSLSMCAFVRCVVCACICEFRIFFLNTHLVHWTENPCPESQWAPSDALVCACNIAVTIQWNFYMQTLFTYITGVCKWLL